jgi:hypothetical protein
MELSLDGVQASVRRRSEGSIPYLKGNISSPETTQPQHRRNPQKRRYHTPIANPQRIPNPIPQAKNSQLPKHTKYPYTLLYIPTHPRQTINTLPKQRHTSPQVFPKPPTDDHVPISNPSRSGSTIQSGAKHPYNRTTVHGDHQPPEPPATPQNARY